MLDKKKVKKQILEFLIIFVVWTLMAALQASQYHLRLSLRPPSENFRTFTWTFIFIEQWLMSLPWIVFTPIIFLLTRKMPFSKKNWLIPLLSHQAISLVFISIHAFITLLIESTYFNPLPADQIFSRIASSFIFVNFYSRMIVYWTIVIIGLALQTYRKLHEKEKLAARLEKSLLSAQLQTLQMKLKPHFLFNTLNTINLLAVEKENKSIEEVVDRLGMLLRSSIGQSDTQFVRLKEEIDIMRSYLGIEEIRFKDRMKIIEDIDEDIMDAFIPQLILQPLVENSIKHGISKKIDSGLIEIGIHRNEDNILIEIKDDGPGFPKDFDLTTHRGNGLNNTIERLEILHPDSYSFNIENGTEQGTKVTLKIPYLDSLPLHYSENE